MRPGWPLATLAAALALAGCASPPDGAPAAADGPLVVTDPRDLLNGTAPGSHIHDYWGGRDRVPVLQEDGDVWSECSGMCQRGMAGAGERPDDGVIVPQGTRWVNGTFAFTPHAENTAATYELWVKTAADGETAFVAEIQPGVPFSIESARERNDPPHYVLSLWQFEVVAKTGGDVTFRGGYRWDVEAVRGLPLEPFPPHPDRWNGADRLDLLEDTGGATVMYGMDGGWSCYASATRCPGVHALPSGGVVPHDASRVEVRLSGNSLGLGVAFHGADTWDFAPATGRLDGADLVFDIPVDGNGDSPYASQSLWEFLVHMDQPQPVEVYSGVYTITATAFR